MPERVRPFFWDDQMKKIIAFIMWFSLCGTTIASEGINNPALYAGQVLPAVDASAATGVLHPSANLSDVGSVSTSLQHLRGNPGSPFVIVCGGQSNAQGADDTGDKTIQSGIKVWNGSAMITAAFGTAPLNVGLSGSTSNPSLAFNNTCVWFANNLRLSSLIPSDREIWIIPNWFSGNTIGNWVGSGTSSTNWVALVNALTGSGVDHIDVMIWIQGEADSLTTPPYNTQATYAAAFSTLYSQWTGLSQWKSWTATTVQQLNLFSGSAYTSNARNDFFNTLSVSPLYQNMTLVRTAGIPQSCEYGGCPSATPHYSGPGLQTLGFRHFLAWASMGLGIGTPQTINVGSDGYPMGNGQYLPCLNGTLTYHDGTTQTATPIPLGINDLRTGAMLGSANCSWSLPVQGLTYGLDFNLSILDVWSVSGGDTVLNNSQGVTVYFNDGTNSSGTSVSLSSTGKYLLYTDRSRWVATQINPVLPTNLYIAGKGFFGSATPFTIAGSQMQLGAITNAGIGRATNDSTGPRLFTYKTRGDYTTRATLTSGDVVGDWLMYGDDGTSDNLVGRFRCSVSGTVSTGIVPGACTISTTNTSGSQVDAVTIGNSGRLAALKGLNVSASDLQFGSRVLFSNTAPTISSGFGTSPSVVASSGTAGFTINVGGGGTASTGVVTMPAATTGWACYVNDLSTTSATVFVTKVTATTTTSVTVGNFSSAGTAAAWASGDVLQFQCSGY